MTAASMTPAIAPPSPAMDQLTSFFWEGARRHELQILRCQSCGHFRHWPKPICNRCQSTDLVPERVSGRGWVISWTVARQAFHPWFEGRVPYTLGIVELAEEWGLKLVTNLVGASPHHLAIGMGVQVEFVEVADGIVLPAFRPTKRAPRL